MTGIESNADLKARIANPSEVESEKAIYEVVLASTKRVFTKCVNVFKKSWNAFIAPWIHKYC